MNRLLIILLGCALAACSGDQGAVGGQATDSAVPVTVAQPTVREVRRVLSALGTVESIQTPTIAAETAGRVLELSVTEGDAVQQGQLLLHIDPTLHRIESAKAQAELRRQEAQVDNQAREVVRLKRLAKTQAVSVDQLEDQESQLLVLEGQRDVARNQWEEARHLESKTRVEAPLPGLITRRHVSIGDYVTVGQPLFNLVATDPLRARLAFPEHQAALIALGQEVSLSSPVAPGQRASGKITSINPQIAAGNRGLEVIVEFPNPGGWLPGSSVDANLLVETRPGALTVPRLSVSRRNGREVVFVQTGERASERPVELGWSDKDWVEVVRGLNPDDSIVVEGAARISDGSRLAISPGP